MTPQRPTFLRVLPAFLLISACAGGEDIDEGVDGISTRSRAYVTLAQDFRRCIAPLCGGFWLSDLNRDREPVYVSGLDFSEAELDEETINQVRETPLGELVIYGRLGPAEPRYQTRALLVRDAYRGLPGLTRRDGDAFFGVSTNDPPIQCFAAPCNNHLARRLNVGGRPRSFTGLELGPGLSPLGDAAWLSRRIEAHGAIVAGRFEQGAVMPAGTELLLVPSQVFVRLPDPIGPCPQIAIRCAPGTVTAFERNADRCVVPSSCVVPEACAEWQPVCADGYTLASWASALGGCPSYACDPSFLSAPEPPFNRCMVVRCAPGFHCVEEGEQACVPNLSCASMLCAPNSHCVEDGAGGAECVADRWASEITALASASPYGNNQRLGWIFTSDHPTTTHVRLNFARFDLEEGYDFVVVQDLAGNELARYSGRLGPFTSDAFAGNGLRITFTTDGSVTRPGFVIDRIDSRIN